MVKQDARPRSQESVGTRITRRTVTRGIAWSTPVLAVATTVPAFAASPCEIDLVLDVNQSCKKANASDYRLVFKITAGACPVPEGCTGTIHKVTETTGQARVLFQGAVAVGDPVLICDANNMSANLLVNASISCDGGVPKDYVVKMNQFTNNASTCSGTDFC